MKKSDTLYDIVRRIVGYQVSGEGPSCQSRSLGKGRSPRPPPRTGSATARPSPVHSTA